MIQAGAAESPDEMPDVLTPYGRTFKYTGPGEMNLTHNQLLILSARLE
jgi:hypothetical protein